LPNMARSPVLPRHDGDIVPSPPALQNLAPSTRQSTRKRVPRDILHPTHHGKAYQAREEKSLKKQRVSQVRSLKENQRPLTLEYEGKQRVTAPAHMTMRRKFAYDTSLPFQTTAKRENYNQMYEQFRTALKEKLNTRIGWSDIFDDLTPEQVKRLFMRMIATRPKPPRLTAHSVFDTPMQKSDLPPVFPNRPLNLNEDGTTITYTKSHTGPYAQHWQQADAEEIERLFTSGTLRPILRENIPAGKNATYVNPVCS